MARTSPVDGVTHVPLNQPIRVVFNQYLDPNSFTYFNAFTVTSGGVWASGLARYRMWERSLTFYPTRPYRPNLLYTLVVNPDTVRSIGGFPLSVPFSLRFETAQAGTVEHHRTLASLSFVASIRPLLEARCDCHYQDEGLNPLAYDTLVGIPSGEVGDRLLVRSFAPPFSYLMHKLIPDYPDRRFTSMPPPWSGQLELDVESIELFENWIWTGARP